MFPDLRHALRSLAKTPSFTVVALLTLALGISVNTAMFSMVNSLLLKPAPYPDADRLVRLFRTSPQSQTWPHSPPDLADLQQQNTVLERMAWTTWSSYSLAEPGQPAENLHGLNVSLGFFRTLGVQPMLGRDFAAEELTPGRDGVVILSQHLWQGRFGGDPAIVGRQIRLDGGQVTVIGVMAESVDYPLLWGRIDAWRPLALPADVLQNRGNHWMNAIGRLKPGVGLGQAQAEFNGISARLTAAYPETNSGSGLRVLRLHDSTMDGAGRSMSYMVFALSGFVLLIACANLANLQLARTTTRIREYVIRAALGASRLRLMRELLTESMLLSLSGGLLGLLLADWLTDLLARQIVIAEGTSFTIEVDARVLGFTLLASVATGLLFGLWPAWQASRADVNTALKSQGRAVTGDRSHLRLRHALIVAEVALALVLLSGAGFFIRGVQRFMALDLGWRSEDVLAATLHLSDLKYPDDTQRMAFYRRLEQRLAALPGVTQVALANSLPLYSYSNSRDLVPEGAPPPPSGLAPLAYYTGVTPGYFGALRIPLRRGRLFPTDLPAGAPREAVINTALAEQFWPGQDPIGKRIGSSDPGNKNWLVVVGVVGNVAFAGNLVLPDTRLQVYVPLSEQAWGYGNVLLRTTTAPDAQVKALRAAVAALDPDLPVINARAIEQTVDQMQHNFRLVTKLLGGFSLLGLLLAALGLYGVISNVVAQRTAEFGIRLALGAQPGGILGLVLAQGLRLILVGTLLGLAGAIALNRVCASLLPGLPGHDPVLLALTVLVLAATAALACWLPARRATRVDPIIALRAE